MFGWLRRFDNWLESKEREAARPHNLDQPTAPKIDWAAREKAVKQAAFKEREVEHAANVEEFGIARAEHSHAATASQTWLSVEVMGRKYGMNREFIMTVEFEPGREPSLTSGHRYVTYDEDQYHVEVDADWYGHDMRYTRVDWCEPAVADVVRFIHVNGTELLSLTIVHGQGEKLYNEIMSALKL